MHGDQSAVRKVVSSSSTSSSTQQKKRRTDDETSGGQDMVECAYWRLRDEVCRCEVDARLWRYISDVHRLGQ